MYENNGSKVESNARKGLNKAIVTLAKREIGPVDSVLVAMAYQVIAGWKKAVLFFWTKQYGKEEALKRVDEFLLRQYDLEVAALKQPTLDPYWTRDAGALEWGISFVEIAPVSRSVVEFGQCTGPEYSEDEDELAHLFKGEFAGNSLEMGRGDVEMEDEDGLHIHEDGGWQNWEEKFVELREALEKSSFQDRGRVLARARVLATGKKDQDGNTVPGTVSLGWRHYGLLRIYAEKVLPARERR